MTGEMLTCKFYHLQFISGLSVKKKSLPECLEKGEKNFYDNSEVWLGNLEVHLLQWRCRGEWQCGIYGSLKIPF